MKNITLTKGIVILAAIAMVGLVATAYAGWGDGYGHRGRGYHHMGWSGPGYGGDYPDLTEEQRQAWSRNAVHLSRIRMICDKICIPRNSR